MHRPHHPTAHLHLPQAQRLPLHPEVALNHPDRTHPPAQTAARAALPLLPTQKAVTKAMLKQPHLPQPNTPTLSPQALNPA